MNELIIPLDEVTAGDTPVVGNKTVALASVIGKGIPVPAGICLSKHAYDIFVQETGVMDDIFVELGRKKFEEMRWEELWDASLRIRNMFVKAEMPEMLRLEIRRETNRCFGERPVAVRSSSLAEDSAGASFAGLHESYVNIRGIDNTIDSIKLVWASLWSDAALLYRKELGLDMKTSAMAVIIQEMIFGEVSGVGFCVDPSDPQRGVIESVYGLNKGLVDGDVEPDRYFLERDSGKVVDSKASRHDRRVEPSESGVRIVDIESTDEMTLGDSKVAGIFSLMLALEDHFGAPQDVEWTIRDGEIYILQTRPITSREKGERGWYLSLRRSLDNLEKLGNRIEEEILPGMERAAEEMALQDLSTLSDEQLAGEVEKRKTVFDEWKDVYWNECIPFAHGVRLFGMIYNDMMSPDDPYEFVELILPENMMSTERNERMLKASEYLRARPESIDESLNISDDHLKAEVEAIMDDMGTFSMIEDDTRMKISVVRMLREMAAGSLHGRRDDPALDEKRKSFIDSFAPGDRDRAESLIGLAMKSYRLRDDDNIYLDKVSACLTSAVVESCRRLGSRCEGAASDLDPTEIVMALRSPEYLPQSKSIETGKKEYEGVSARQLRGQPAGKGIAKGIARVIESASDLFEVKKDEILVCDSIDPSMTFVVPLVSGIVERRGGMLIHGAIIAREYGIACVTGIPLATEYIHTGDQLTIDGYRGIVINHSRTYGGS